MITRPALLAAAASMLFSVAACGESTPAPAYPPSPMASAPGAVPSPTSSSPSTVASPAATAVARASTPVDASQVAALTGGKPESSESVVKVSFPRDDVSIEIDGWAKMPPFMGLTSWAGFTPGEKPGVEAMVMGDLVVLEDEVNPVMSAALDNGLEVTALHNHFFYDKPRVYFMHIGGEGSVDKLGKGVKAALDAQKFVRKIARLATGFAATPAVSGASKVDGAKLDPIFGIKGQSKDGMYKATMGRKTTAECGCTVGKAMGVNTWAAFAGTDEAAVVDGDFAVTENELQPVLKTLRAGHINIVAIHSHMTGENPRILFLHYWGRAPAADLAKTIKRALDLTAWDGKTSST